MPSFSLDRLFANWRQPVAVAVASSVLTVTVAVLGGWERLDLAMYDGLVRWRQPESPDDRILLVKITQTDLEPPRQSPIPDVETAAAIRKLLANGAIVVGLDLFRDAPIPPNARDLRRLWEEDLPVVGICDFAGNDGKGTAAPPQTQPERSQGFADLPLDRDSVVRRSILYVDADPQSRCLADRSFSLQLAARYLASRRGLAVAVDEGGNLRIGGKMVGAIEPHAGGYRNQDTGGYQVFLNYRHSLKLADSVTFSSLMNDRVPRGKIANRIVIIGRVDSSSRDVFETPFSATAKEDFHLPGMVIHGHATSQILSHVLDNRPLIRPVDDLWEYILIVFYAGLSSWLFWYWRQPRWQLFVFGSGILSLGILTIVPWYSAAIWMPVAAPLVAFFLSSGLATIVANYQTWRERERMRELILNRDQMIEALQLVSTPLPNFRRDKETYLPTTAAALPQESLLTTVQSQQPTVPLGQIDTNTLLDGRYQTLDILGSGGFAITYLAKDIKRPRQPLCAIKHLLPSRRDPSFINLARRLFQSEAEIMEKLGGHPNIPKLLAYFEQYQEFYLVQEYIEGTSLDVEFANRDRPWNEAEAVQFLTRLLPTIETIHDFFAIHRDLKPSNLIRRHRDGQIVPIDFGAVKELQQDELDRTIAIGTRGYAPREQYEGRPNFTSDLYAIGKITIEGITGTSARELLSDDRTGKIIWRHLAPHISDSFADILDRAIADLTIDRYPSARDFLSAIRNYR
jgi:CHASE2 domain-containing sensor protein